MTLPETAPEELRVTSIAEIQAYLRQLQRDRAAVLLNAPPGHSLNGHVCALDADTDVLGVEIGADPAGVSQALVAGGEITAVAYLGTIKLQFELDNAVLVSGDQGAVLRSRVPTRLYRFQRRQSFRVQPASNIYPRVTLPGGNQPARTLRVLDLSIGGLALALPAGLAGAVPLSIGQPCGGVELELDRGTALQVALLPHHASPITGDVRGLLQLGCAFVDLDTAAARELQLYVDQTQKRRRLLKLDA